MSGLLSRTDMGSRDHVQADLDLRPVINVDDVDTAAVR
jgi:hypothetical protein